MKNIAISGAGLVGSLLAIYLAKRGFNVDIYERRPDMRKLHTDGGRSINLALSDRGWRALERVGLEDEIWKISIPMNGRMIHDQEGNLDLQPYGKEDQAIYSVSRAGLNAKLMDLAEKQVGIRLHFNQKCNKVNLRKPPVSMELYDTEKKIAKEVFPDILFGADGAFSSVRSSMQRTDLFNYTQQYLPHGYKELEIPAAKDGSHKMYKNALHIWPRKSFMLIALPNLDGSFTCTLFLALKGEVSFETLKTPLEVEAFFRLYFADALKFMPRLYEDFFDNPTSSLVTVRCNPWIKNDTVALIGDASHAIVPFYGQGMNSGFEDCYVFDQLLEEKSGNFNWKELLESYQNLRIPDANAIADLALRNFVEMRNSVINPNFILRKQMEKHLNKKYGDAYLPLYSMVTFSELRYSEALNYAKIQDELFDILFKEENVEERWKKGLLDGRLDQIFEEYLLRQKTL